MTVNSFSISIRDARIILFGGEEKNFSADINGGNKIINVLFGRNGAGKTISLRSIAKIASLPLDPIKNIQATEKSGGLSYTGFDPEIAISTYVYQKPEDNFDNSPIADNIRAFLHRSERYNTEAAEQIVNLISSKLNLTSEDLKRKPSQFSSGQLQFIAVVLRALIKPEFTFLDEPFSRLSRYYREMLLDIIDELTGKTNIILTLLPDDNGLMNICNSSVKSSLITRTADDIKIKCNSDIKGSDTIDDLRNVHLLDLDSLQSGIKKFEQNPTKLCFIESKNTDSLLISGNISLFSGKSGILSTDFKINSGLNLLIGDNGSGKTLLCRTLCGGIQRRNIPNKILYSLSGVEFLTYQAHFNSNQYGDKNKIKNINSFYIPPEPILISESSINEEKKNVNPKGVELIDEICGFYDIDQEDDIFKQPYSILKIVQLCLIPEKADLVALDEIFGSLSYDLSKMVSGYIRHQVNNERWKVCLITSNKPNQLVSIFQEN